jgi:2-C-methyl-D-erythritol 4-phosphate cytidylyltransferase
VWAILAGKPVLAWAIGALLQISAVDAIVVVVSPYGVEAAQHLTEQDSSRVQVATASGPRLQDALRAGLQALPSACEWVVVHDGARPLLTPELVATGITAARQMGAAAACEPVKETLKRVRDGIVTETPARSRLALLQTPQVFTRLALTTALQTSDPHADLPDAGALAIAADIPLATFTGSSENLRVVTAGDLALAAELLARQADTA